MQSRLTHLTNKLRTRLFIMRYLPVFFILYVSPDRSTDHKSKKNNIKSLPTSQNTGP